MRLVLSMVVFVLLLSGGEAHSQVTDERVQEIAESYEKAIRLSNPRSPSFEGWEVSRERIERIEASVPVEALTISQLLRLYDAGVIGTGYLEDVNDRVWKRVREVMKSEGAEGARASLLHARMMTADRIHRPGGAKYIARAMRAFFDHPQCASVPFEEARVFAETTARNAIMWHEARTAVQALSVRVRSWADDTLDTEVLEELEASPVFMDLLWITDTPTPEIRIREHNLAYERIRARAKADGKDLDALLDSFPVREDLDAETRARMRLSLAEMMYGDRPSAMGIGPGSVFRGDGGRPIVLDYFPLECAGFERSYARGVESFDDYKGDIVIVQVWAPWCERSKASFDAMRELAASYRADLDVRVLGITANEDVSTTFDGEVVRTGYDEDKKEQLMRRFIDDADITWEIVTVSPGACELVQVERLPTVLILDRDGREHHREVLMTEDLDRLRALVEKVKGHEQ